MWKTVFCVAGATADPAGEWFETRNAGVVQRLFASVAEGWVVDDGVEEARCSGANYTSVQQGEKEQEQEQEQEEVVVVGGKAISMLDGENVAGRAQVRGLVVLVGFLLWWEGV